MSVFWARTVTDGVGAALLRSSETSEIQWFSYKAKQRSQNTPKSKNVEIINFPKKYKVF